MQTFLPHLVPHLSVPSFLLTVLIFALLHQVYLVECGTGFQDLLAPY